MIVYIKNMVCVRCKMAVQSVLEALQIGYLKIELGRAELAADLSPGELQQLNNSLKHYELELMEDRKKILTERIKVLIIDLFHAADTNLYQKFSEYLAKILFYDYTYLANTFSEVEGTTIERFYIETRVERAKELMVYEDMRTTEIAYQLNFASVSHFCLQFKKVTGQTPSQFKKLCGSPGYVWKKCEQ